MNSANGNGPLPLDEHLLTLSALPSARWKHLAMLEQIKVFEVLVRSVFVFAARDHPNFLQERNKPKDPVKAPSTAPFFLSTYVHLSKKPTN